MLLGSLECFRGFGVLRCVVGLLWGFAAFGEVWCFPGFSGFLGVSGFWVTVVCGFWVLFCVYFGIVALGFASAIWGLLVLVSFVAAGLFSFMFRFGFGFLLWFAVCDFRCFD